MRHNTLKTLAALATVAATMTVASCNKEEEKPVDAGIDPQTEQNARLLVGEWFLDEMNGETNPYFTTTWRFSTDSAWTQTSVFPNVGDSIVDHMTYWVGHDTIYRRYPNGGIEHYLLRQLDESILQAEYITIPGDGIGENVLYTCSRM